MIQANVSVLEELRSLKQELQDSLDLPTLKTRASELEAVTTAVDFWSREDSQDYLRELSGITGRLGEWERVCRELDDLDVLDEMLREDDDAELQREFETRANELRQTLDRRQLLLLLNEEYDTANAILTVHAGSGGLDSQDWAEMLLRMYLRWAERDGFRAAVLEASSDEEAGIKSATVLVGGDYAYGYLKAEKGVHRLVRISPFDSAHRRHTSFASVGVSPELPESVEVEIRSEDLRVDTFRASGAGGQYVNRTDSAVRITHIPTGIVVSCQNERSQHMNRQVAMQVLKSRLYERAVQERSEELAAVVGDKKESTWGSQIRSYVLHPYTLVKDHRTGVEKGNVQSVLDGDIDEFIMSYLRWRR
ncbi:MAG: peptide chain release factor 2 [Synergistaceae bacterium]|nr:peptide chain release factor 2 [Synergistaceae bacterium]